MSWKSRMMNIDTVGSWRNASSVCWWRSVFYLPHRRNDTEYTPPPTNCRQHEHTTDTQLNTSERFTFYVELCMKLRKNLLKIKPIKPNSSRNLL